MIPLFISMIASNIATPWKRESRRDETLTCFGIAVSARRSAYRLVQVAWTVTSRRQLRPIKSTYILQGKESAKACREGETMRKEKREVEESVEFSSRLGRRIRWPRRDEKSLLNETFNINWPLRSHYICLAINTTLQHLILINYARKCFYS